MIIQTFTGSSDFEANSAAEKWCREQGISYGSMQRDAPRGLMWGDYDIPKWRNLDAEDVAGLDGRMTSADFRAGPITVSIREKPNT